MRLKPHRPSHEILSGESADVYFARATRILEREGLDPVVAMEVFSRGQGVLCGIDEAKNLLAHALEHAVPTRSWSRALDDGDLFSPKEVVLRIRARYRAFGLYETAILGMMAQATGWATAARECVEAAAPQPVISFGARHVHPDVTDVLDYAAIVGGCVGASTPAGARLANLNPTGTMPHSLVLIVGRHRCGPPRRSIATSSPTCPGSSSSTPSRTRRRRRSGSPTRSGDKLYGIRLDTPSERGRVTADLVKEIRARLDQAGHGHVRIVVSGGLTPDRIRYFKEQGAPADSFAVGQLHLGRQPHRLHGRHQGDRREADREARPDPGDHAEPQAAAGRPRRLAERRLTGDRPRATS